MPVWRDLIFFASQRFLSLYEDRPLMQSSSIFTMHVCVCVCLIHFPFVITRSNRIKYKREGRKRKEDKRIRNWRTKVTSSVSIYTPGIWQEEKRRSIPYTSQSLLSLYKQPSTTIHYTISISTNNKNNNKALNYDRTRIELINDI